VESSPAIEPSDTGAGQPSNTGAGEPPRAGWPFSAQRPSRSELICWLAIVLSGVYALALLPAVPALIGTKPVLLELLRGSTSSMVAAGAFARVGQASLPLALLAGVVGIAKYDWLWWWAGRLWGRAVLEFIGVRSPRVRRAVDRIEHSAGRWGWLAVIVAPFLPIPTALIYAVVGWTGMRLWRFVAYNILGSALWTGMCVALGYAIGQSAVDAAKAVSHYALWVSLGLVVAIIARQAWRMRRGDGLPMPASK
jgi:membrane protein DedA with SNARE-associated domain